MFYPFFVILVDDDSDDIESNVVVVLITIDERVCSPDEMSLLINIDSRFRFDEVGAVTSLHFDKDDGVAVFCNDVDFFMSSHPILF